MGTVDSLQKEFPFMRPLPKRGRKYIYPMDFGISCGDGWYDILREVCVVIQSELKTLPKKDQKNFLVEQVKEKFGGLRFYISGGTEAMYEAIDKAEEKSFNTCELCGRKGVLGEENGWYKTRCGRCAKKNFRPVEREVEGNMTTIDNNVASFKVKVGK